VKPEWRNAMADEKTEAKTKAIGKLPAKIAATLEGWKEYEASAKALSEARKKSEVAKDKIRDMLAEKLNGQVPDNATLDFVVESDGTVRVFALLNKEKTSRGNDLSEMFAAPKGKK
jgi:hypothetical protein